MSTKRTLYNTKIEKIIDHNPTVRELFIRFLEPAQFQFRAGQFAMLHVPQAGSEKPALRAYSIASDDRATDHFRLIFKFVPGGVASTFVWTLKTDQNLTFTGPFGRVFFQEPPSEQILFLCTGTGLAPHICYLESKADLFPELKYRMLFGLSTEQDIFYFEQLEALKKKMRNFDYDIVLSRSSESWKGKKGYIQDHLKDIDYKSIPTSFYLCGNGKMIHQVKELLIQGNGIEPSKVFSEAFD